MGLAMTAIGRSAAADDGGPPVARKHTLLMVDDRDILYRAGTERVFVPARKHDASPVVSEEHVWEKAIGWTSVSRNPETGIYQLWYQAYAGRGHHPKTHDCVVCYAESPDGIQFSKPKLGLHSFNDIADTNIVLIGNGGYGDRYGNAVIVDPREPDPAKRYKMAYYDWSVRDGREFAGLHLAFSPDGVRWTKHPGLVYPTAYGARGMQPPRDGEETYFESPGKNDTVRKRWVLPNTMSDAADVMFDPVRKCFAIYGKLWIDGPDGSMGWKHAMGRVESADLLHWTKPRVVCFPDEFDLSVAEFHTSPVFWHSGRFYCLNQILDRRKDIGGIDIELMVSHDGLDWERPFRDGRFLARGEPGSFDSGSLFTNATPVVLGDEMRFYYGAYGSTAIGGGEAIEGPRQRSGVGLAILPRDRFAGLRSVPVSDQPTLKNPLQDTGQVTLKPLDFTGCTDIVINADAAGGEVRCELLTEDGYRVPGFEKENGAPLKKDAIRFRLSWKDRKIAELPPASYCLRIHLKKATLYAVTFR
ncbi:MAG: hypothetical protein KDM91_04545 [Verrucomicrobiae bacterium]|nr:hypothetical protein [Verrucomicrobiae bacterium]